MRDKDKTKEQPISELDRKRQKITELENKEAEGKEAEEALRRSEESFRVSGRKASNKGGGNTIHDSQSHRHRAIGRNPHIWYITAIMAACLAIYYVDSIIDLVGWPKIQWGFLYTVHDLHRLLFLIPVLYAAYIFRVRGVIVTVLILIPIFLPRAMFASPYPDALLRSVIFVIIIGGIGILLSRLLDNITERKQAEETLAKAKDDLEIRVTERTAELAKANENLSREIVERKRTQEALEAAHAFQQSIIDGVAEPIMVIGVDHRVKLMNRAAREFSSGLTDTLKPLFCYQISHQRETPCDGMKHPCPLEKVRESGRPVTVVHEYYQKNEEQRFFEVIASPLLGGDGTFQGIIESKRDITERKRVEETLQQYTERLRALAAQLAELTETERQQLAQELHDQVGQNLTALGINLNIVQTQLPEESTDLLRSRVDESLSLVEQTAERIRDVMANLRPPVLDDYGLVSALRWYGEQFARRTDIAVIVEGEEPVPRLDAQVENTLFRIAQETLTNVAKHAQATQVTITVDVDNRTVRLVVADDGIGFDTAQRSALDGGHGLGLLIMNERAEAVGGVFRIESHPGGGTKLIVEVTR